MKELQKYGIPVNISINSTNISQQYQDIVGQLENLKIQESLIASTNFLLYLTSQVIIWFFKLVPFAMIFAAVYSIFAWFKKKKPFH